MKYILSILLVFLSLNSFAEEQVNKTQEKRTNKVKPFKAMEPDYSNSAKMKAYYNACLRVYEKELTFGIRLSDEELIQETICKLNSK